MKLQDIQKQLPWTIKYSSDFRDNPQKHKDFSHAVLHATKALGKVAAVVEDLDHHKDADHEFEKYVADLVICALRIANTSPKPFDLHDAIIERLETKNNVKMTKDVNINQEKQDCPPSEPIAKIGIGKTAEEAVENIKEIPNSEEEDSKACPIYNERYPSK